MSTLWVDAETGAGVDDTGAGVQARLEGRRKSPTLVGLLDAAARAGAERIMLTGKVPTPASAWLLTQTPGWQAERHWLDDPPTGRFHPQGRVRADGTPDGRVMIKTAAEWFGDLPLTPQQARWAWQVLGEALAQASQTSKTQARLMHTPGSTALNLWAISLPSGLDPEPLPQEVADLLHATTGQHRIQHLTPGPSACECGQCVPMIDPAGQDRRSMVVFGYIDGRFMYGAQGLTRELGGGPVQWLTGQQVTDLLATKRGWYTRGRMRVRFQVPEGWRHVGILGVQRQDQVPGAYTAWHYPNRPGTVAETWADFTEVHLAHTHGWKIEPVEAITFTPGRWMETWRDRIVRARDQVGARTDLDPLVRQAAGAGLRMMLLQGIGSFYSRGRSEIEVVTDPSTAQLPPGMDETSLTATPDGVFYYKVPAQQRLTGFYQPHLAAQIWGRSRARVLEGPAGGDWKGMKTGLLALPPAAVLGVHGDAIYTADAVPTWSLPTSVGGGDDGQPGRLRLQGVLLADPGKMRTPPSVLDREKLRRRAVEAGPQVDQVLHEGVAI